MKFGGYFSKLFPLRKPTKSYNNFFHSEKYNNPKKTEISDIENAFPARNTKENEQADNFRS